MAIKVSFIIVNYNTANDVLAAIASIHQLTLLSHEIIVVDNASSDDSVALIKQRYPHVTVIASSVNHGFGVANNIGAKAAVGEYLMFFNSDALLQSDTATVLTEYLATHQDVVCVGPRVVLPDTLTIQPKAFGNLPTPWRILMQSIGLNRLVRGVKLFAGIDGDRRWATAMCVGWISGVCMVMRKVDFMAVSGFDSRIFMYCEDIELCMKLSKIGKVVLLDKADIIHIGGASSKTVESKIRNSIWQQRNLLMIVRDYYGLSASWLSTVFIGMGLIVRLLTSLIFIPLKGVKQNQVLQTSWARLCDLLGCHKLSGVKR